MHTYSKQKPTRVLIQSCIYLNNLQSLHRDITQVVTLIYTKTAYKDVNRLKPHLKGSFGAILLKVLFPDYYRPSSGACDIENIHNQEQQERNFEENYVNQSIDEACNSACFIAACSTHKSKTTFLKKVTVAIISREKINCQMYVQACQGLEKQSPWSQEQNRNISSTHVCAKRVTFISRKCNVLRQHLKFT